MPKRLLRPVVRRYVYGVAIAAVPLLQVYGIVSEETAPLWAAVLGSALVPVLAVGNTPAPEYHPDHPNHHVAPERGEVPPLPPTADCEGLDT